MIRAEISVYPKCPSCGNTLYIREKENVFTCMNEVKGCINTTKYKIPTIELEEIEE